MIYYEKLFIYVNPLNVWSIVPRGVGMQKTGEVSTTIESDVSTNFIVIII
jgi:hypothetical protein